MAGETVIEEEKHDGEEQKPSITAYLQAPRKKRKNYVLIATKATFDRTTVNQIEGYVKRYHNSLAIAKPTTVQDLRRQLNRNISLLVLDDEFAPLGPLLLTLRKVREKRRKEIIPILFLTRNADHLIEVYHQVMAGYQEVDEFVEYPRIERSQIIGRVKVGIEQKNRRRSRRFKVRTEITYYLLRQDRGKKAKLVDISMHGALIEASDGEMFRVGDQLKLMIPGERLLGGGSGEFLRLSAKVRRVFINGSSAGISFEYMSENQNTMLTKMISGIMTNTLTGG